LRLSLSELLDIYLKVPAHGPEKAGTEFPLEVLHGRRMWADMHCPMATFSERWVPSVFPALFLGDPFHFPEKLAGLHVSSIEQKCSKVKRPFNLGEELS
jgi:hypothetical protein